MAKKLKDTRRAGSSSKKISYKAVIGNYTLRHFENVRVKE